jgi:hypothetical protein
MTALETKNILEKETNIQVTVKEIRAMTVSGFLEILNKHSSSTLIERADLNKITMTENQTSTEYFHETIVRVPSLSLNNDVDYTSCVLVIPDAEGWISADYSPICSSLKLPTFILPLFNTWSCQNVQKIAQFVFEVSHGLFLEGVYKIESDTKTEYGGF